MLKKIKIHFVIISLLLFSFPSFAVTVNINLLNMQQLPVSNVAIYLTPTDSSLPLGKNTHAININQQNRAFIPHINIMQKGNSINFNNKDNITHHIYSPVGENKFAFKIRAGDTYVESNLTATGEVTMGCNIHDWMSGYLLIVDTPYYAITNEVGVVSFELLHEGEYTVTLWHPLLEEKERKISHTKNITDNINITLNIDDDKIKQPIQKQTDDFDFLSDY